jgi:hypothetical protein
MRCTAIAKLCGRVKRLSTIMQQIQCVDISYYGQYSMVKLVSMTERTDPLWAR